jgi:hypothetical protein
MRVLEIITESKNTEQLDELDLKKVGRGVGKVARGAATATGAVAGGLVGAGKAFMKGFRGAKAFVGGNETPQKTSSNKQNTPSAGTASAASGATTAQSTTLSTTTSGNTAAQPVAAPTASAAKAGTTGKVNMKVIKSSIQSLPKNQRASLRKIIAAKAGTA